MENVVEHAPTIDGERAPLVPISHREEFFELAADAFFVTDALGKVVAANATAATLITGADGVGRALEDVLHADDAIVFRDALDGLAERPEQLRCRLHTRGGRVARCQLVASRSADGGSVLWMVRVERGPSGPEQPLRIDRSAADHAAQVLELMHGVRSAERQMLTERMAREDADGRDRIKQWTMAIVAHGLRLTVEHIRHWGARMVAGDVTSDGVVEAEIIRRQVAIQAELLEDLLDPSRVAERKLRADFVTVDPFDAARFAARTFERLAAARSVEIACRAQPLGVFPADPVRLAQAFTNLAWVAIELSSPGAQVVIDGARTDDAISLTFEWHGQPLRTQQLDWQLERLGDGQLASDRIGMSCLVARQLVQLHGGRLGVARHADERQELVATFPLVSASPSRARARLAPL